jgi:hypothetical protein
VRGGKPQQLAAHAHGEVSLTPPCVHGQGAARLDVAARWPSVLDGNAWQFQTLAPPPSTPAPMAQCRTVWLAHSNCPLVFPIWGCGGGPRKTAIMRMWHSSRIRKAEPFGAWLVRGLGRRAPHTLLPRWRLACAHPLVAYVPKPYNPMTTSLHSTPAHPAPPFPVFHPYVMMDGRRWWLEARAARATRARRATARAWAARASCTVARYRQPRDII